MNKVKLLSAISIGLLLCNLALLFFLFRKPHHMPRPEGPRNAIIEKLHFDDDQVKQYDALIQTHQQSTRAIQDSIGILKNQLYQGLNTAISERTNDSIINAIAVIQVQMENIHFEHFNGIQKICRPEQQVAFSELTNELAALFSPHGDKSKR